MIRDVLGIIIDVSWRDWFDCMAALAWLCVFIAAVFLICVGFAPDLNS